MLDGESMSWIQCFSFAEQVWRLAVPQRGRTQRTECELRNGRDGKFGELRLLTVTSHEKTNVIISDLWLQVGLWIRSWLDLLQLS